MGLMDPVIRACCDRCLEDSDEIGLTPLARSGSYDERNVENTLRRMGWTIDGDKTICPDCALPAIVRSRECECRGSDDLCPCQNAAPTKGQRDD